MNWYSEDMGDIDRCLSLAIRGGRNEAADEELRSLYAVVDDAELRRAAQRNQVYPLVAHGLLECLSQANLEPAHHWREVSKKNDTRVKALTNALVTVGRRLDERGVRWALMENAGVLFSSKLPLRAFCSGDFDLLVEGDRWSDVYSAFEESGFQPESRRKRRTNRVEFQKQTDEFLLCLSAAAEPFDRIWIPFHYAPRQGRWLQRRVSSDDREGIYTLAPEDLLAQVATHTSLHTYVRAPGVRLHIDVERLVRRHEIDWSRAAKEIEALGVTRRCFVSLAMARGLLDAPVPEDVLHSLCPGQSWWASVSRLLATESVFDDGTPKLARHKTVWLDLMLDGRGPLPWLRDIFCPPEQWLRNSFVEPDAANLPLWRLHMTRYRRLYSRWRPS